MSMESAKVTFDDFALLEAKDIREKVWDDLSRQHRIPEPYRVTTSMWAEALSNANLRVANKLMLNAPPKARDRIGSLIIFQKTPPSASREAQQRILDVYRYDLLAVRYPEAVAEETRPYNARVTQSELPKHFRVDGRVLLDTDGIRGAAQFSSSAGLAYGLESNAECLRKVYRTIMSDKDDALRAVVGESRAIELPTGRIDVLRARVADFTGDCAKASVAEFSRLVHPAGLVFVEGSLGEMERLARRLPQFQPMSDTALGWIVD